MVLSCALCVWKKCLKKKDKDKEKDKKREKEKSKGGYDTEMDGGYNEVSNRHTVSPGWCIALAMYHSSDILLTLDQ